MVIEREEMLGLLPHRGKMLMIDRVTDYDMKERSLTAAWKVPGDSIFFNRALGGVPGWAVYECMAQAISVLSGLRNKMRGEKPKMGFILSVQGMKVDVPVLKEGELIEVSVREDYQVDLVYTFSGEARFGAGSTIADARLTVMDVDDEQAKQYNGAVR